MIRRLLPLVAAIALTACATTPTYTRAATPNGAGYSEQQIESNRFYVTYRAAGSADAARLEDMALLRAADVTLEHNHDWFWVDRRNVDNASSTSSGPTIGVGVGGASFGGHSAFGSSVGLSFPLGQHHDTASAATLEIRFGEGAKPDDANAYDARALSANLRARLMSPR